MIIYSPSSSKVVKQFEVQTNNFKIRLRLEPISLSLPANDPIKILMVNTCGMTTETRVYFGLWNDHHKIQIPRAYLKGA